MWLHILKLIRWPNLLIIFITQWIVWSNLIGYSLSQHSISHNLNLVHFVLLSLCTMLVAAAGYIINDIKDVKIDLINKPHKVIVGKDLTSQFCSSLYYSTLGIGLLITIYLGWSLDKVPYILLFPIFTGLLHIYATHLKKSLLLGNFLISLFVASVPVLIFLAEYENVIRIGDIRILHILSLYCLLAFLANFLREIVKDIQDLKGDKAFGANTFPILFGKRKSKFVLTIILLLLLSSILIWTLFFDKMNQNTMSIVLGTAPLVLIASILLLSLPKLETAVHFGNWSNGIKLFMLFGLVFLYLQT